MALITWQDMLERAKRPQSIGQPGALITNRAEFKKGFDFFIEKWASRYKHLSKDQQFKRLSDLINPNINKNNGKFVIGPGQGFKELQPHLQWDALVKKNPNTPAAFENYLKSAKAPEMVAIAKKKIPLNEKWDLLSSQRQVAARKSMQVFKSLEGRLLLKDFAPLTNFSTHYLRRVVVNSNKKIPKTLNAENIRQAQDIIRSHEIKNFLTKNNIEVFQKPIGAYDYWRDKLTTARGPIYFTKPNSTQQKALDDFLNLNKAPSKLERKILIRDSHRHPLYKDTSKNLKAVLNAARSNLNSTIEGYNDKGLRKFLKQNPRMLKNATMWFNTNTGKINYTPLDDIYKKGFDMGKLRTSLKFDIEHNRPIVDYWNKLSKDGKISAKNALLNDADFAHNLSVDTSRYNRGAKEAISKWIEKNPTKTTEITALEKELGELGHRFYAGDKWR